MNNSKLNMIAKYLETGSLNTFEAIQLGDTCLNTTISVLRSRGMPILDEWEEVPNRFGGVTRVKRYWLDQEAIKKRESEKKHA